MPLPFLKKTQEASVVSSPEHIKREPDEDKEESFDALETAAEELCNAIDRKDYKAIAEAWRAGNELMEREPHVEGPHTEEGE